MFSDIPFDPAHSGGEELEKHLLRLGMIHELDAINFCEQMAALSADPSVQAAFRRVAADEKQHMGEFETLLLRHDSEQTKELGEGTEAVESAEKKGI